MLIRTSSIAEHAATLRKHEERAPLTRSSSREVGIRVPFVLWSILVGEPSQPKKEREGALLGDLAEV